MIPDGVTFSQSRAVYILMKYVKVVKKYKIHAGN